MCFLEPDTQEDDCGQAASSVKDALLCTYKGTDKREIKYFHGLTVHRARSKLFLDQTEYASKLTQQAEGLVWTPKCISLPPSQYSNPLEHMLTDEAAARYHQTVGQPMYLATMTRPDLADSNGYLVRHMSQPYDTHDARLGQVLDYLHTTHSFVLHLGHQSDERILGSMDSEWGQEPFRKSVYGYCFQLDGSLISWRSTKFLITACSSVEAEHMAAGEATKEALHIRWLMCFFYGKCCNTALYR
jgi:hypothetical protein